MSEEGQDAMEPSTTEVGVPLSHGSEVLVVGVHDSRNIQKLRAAVVTGDEAIAESMVVPPASTARAETGLKQQLACEGCGLLYRDFPCDFNVSDEVWQNIMGRPGGVLCGNCIGRRIMRETRATYVRMEPGIDAPARLAGAPEDSDG